MRGHDHKWCNGMFFIALLVYFSGTYMQVSAVTITSLSDVNADTGGMSSYGTVMVTGSDSAFAEITSELKGNDTTGGNIHVQIKTIQDGVSTSSSLEKKFNPHEKVNIIIATSTKKILTRENINTLVGSTRNIDSSQRGYASSSVSIKTNASTTTNTANLKIRQRIVNLLQRMFWFW